MSGMPTAVAAQGAMELGRRVADRLRWPATTRTLYEVLGVDPGADDGQIKAAYRELARRLHPDANAGDAALAPRLAEVNHAYEILSDQRTRAAYDHALAGQRAQMQRHYALLGAWTGVAFFVTMVAVSFLVRWHLNAASPEPPPAHVASEPSGRSPHALRAAAPDVPEDASFDQPKIDDAGWTTFSDPRFAFTLSYPAGIFAFDPAQSDAHMHTFVSRDRRATFRIVAAENSTGVTLARFRKTLIKKRYAGATFEQTPQQRHWFALAGTMGEEAFLERVTFSCDGKAVHGWQMRYPVSQRATYDELGKLMLRNHPHNKESSAACEGKPRRKRARP